MVPNLRMCCPASPLQGGHGLELAEGRVAALVFQATESVTGSGNIPQEADCLVAAVLLNCGLVGFSGQVPEVTVPRRPDVFPHEALPGVASLSKDPLEQRRRPAPETAGAQRGAQRTPQHGRLGLATLAGGHPDQRHPVVTSPFHCAETKETAPVVRLAQPALDRPRRERGGVGRSEEQPRTPVPQAQHTATGGAEDEREQLPRRSAATAVRGRRKQEAAAVGVVAGRCACMRPILRRPFKQRAQRPAEVVKRHRHLAVGPSVTRLSRLEGLCASLVPSPGFRAGLRLDVPAQWPAAVQQIHPERLPRHVSRRAELAARDRRHVDRGGAPGSAAAAVQGEDRGDGAVENHLVTLTVRRRHNRQQQLRVPVLSAMRARELIKQTAWRFPLPFAAGRCCTAQHGDGVPRVRAGAPQHRARPAGHHGIQHDEDEALHADPLGRAEQRIPREERVQKP